jgi:hypothetical protein
MTRRLAPDELDELGALLTKLLPESDRETPIGDCGASAAGLD